MRRLIITVGLALLTACTAGGGGTQPPTPRPPQLLVLSVIVTDRQDVRLEGVRVLVDGHEFITNENGGFLTSVAPGEHTIEASKEGYVQYTTPLDVQRRKRLLIGLDRAIPPIQRVDAFEEHRTFTVNGERWRWKGVSAFRLLDEFAQGHSLTPYVERFKGFNVWRVWLYTPWKNKAGEFIGWPVPDQVTVLRFLQACAKEGIYVELTLLTDNDPGKVRQARDLVSFLATQEITNLFIEIANEPDVNGIKTEQLTTVVGDSGFVWSSGDYDPSNTHKGLYITYHSPRDSEWPRKSKALREFWDGGGPTYPTEPAIHKPAVADEPIRPDQAGFNAQDFYTYFALASLSGAGATFHYDGTKGVDANGNRRGILPTPEEGRCLDAALAGLLVFAPDAGQGPYRRPDDHTLRTYVIGNYMVRVRPTTPDAPESGWIPLDEARVAWRR